MRREGKAIEQVGGMVRVVFDRPEACGKCGACNHKHCTSVLLPGKARPGDTVEVEMPDRRIIGASAIAYILPLCMLLVGMLLGRPLAAWWHVRMETELFSALCGGAMLMVAVFIVHLLDKRLRIRQEWQPHIVSVQGQDEKHE